MFSSIFWWLLFETWFRVGSIYNDCAARNDFFFQCDFNCLFNQQVNQIHIFQPKFTIVREWTRIADLVLQRHIKKDLRDMSYEREVDHKSHHLELIQMESNQPQRSVSGRLFCIYLGKHCEVSWICGWNKTHCRNLTQKLPQSLISQCGWAGERLRLNGFY